MGSNGDVVPVADLRTAQARVKELERVGRALARLVVRHILTYSPQGALAQPHL